MPSVWSHFEREPTRVSGPCLQVPALKVKQRCSFSRDSKILPTISTNADATVLRPSGKRFGTN